MLNGKRNGLEGVEGECLVIRDALPLPKPVSSVILAEGAVTRAVI